MTPPGFAERKPSEIPSRTQSVSAFLLDKASVGAPLLRQRSLRALQHRHPLKIAPCSNTEGESGTRRPPLLGGLFFLRPVDLPGRLAPALRWPSAPNWGMGMLRTSTVFRTLVGKRLRRLLRADNRLIEQWNDDLPPSKRDRLGLKEARFQSLLAQVLRERGYGVIVESYFSKRLTKQSCDIYAYRYGRGCWIEIKQQDVDPYFGGRKLLTEVLTDIGKIKAGKSRGELGVLWIGFYGHWSQMKECFLNKRLPYRLGLGPIQPALLKAAWKSDSTQRAKKSIRKLLARADRGAVATALLDLKRWINSKGGRGEIVLAFRPKTNVQNHWVAYGIFCGMIP